MANNVSLSYPSSFYHQFFDRNGKPLTSGKLYTYIAGSLTPIVTYKTIGGGTESANMNTNPIILDMAGMAEIVISTDTAYKFVLFDKNDVRIATWDNVTAGGSEGGGISNVYVEGTTNEIDVENVSEGSIRRFIVSLSTSIKNVISDLSSSVSDILTSLSSKKDKQQPVSKSGSTTKVPVSFSQDANGVFDVEFDDISFPDWTTAINNAVSPCEKTSNKKNSITGYESSTTAYPSIKAVVDFMNSVLQNLGGKLITDNGNPFTSSASLPTTTPFQGVDIANKDYAYIQDVGTAERWSATVSGSSVTWQQEYSISIPVFTPTQQEAIDSTATATKIGNYDSHLANMNNPHGVTAAQVGALTPTGNGSDVTAAFTAAGSRVNIATGEKLSVIFGKIAKWFVDLKALAFRDSVGTAQIEDDSITAAKVKDNETLPVHISGTAESSKRFNNEIGTSGVDGHRAIFGGIDSENNAKISMSEKTGGISKSTEITPSGITTTGGIIIGGDIIIGGSNPATDVKDNSNLAVLIASKANKASSGNGNLAVIDANGNYASSGISAYDQSQINSLVINNAKPWIEAASYVQTQSFFMKVTQSLTGQALQFRNDYTGEKLLHVILNYRYDVGTVELTLRMNIDWNSWIKAGVGGGALVTANGTKHTVNSGTDTVNPFFDYTETSILSTDTSDVVIGSFDIGKSSLYDTNSYYEFIMNIFNLDSGKSVTLKITLMTKRIANPGAGVWANLIGMATLEASGFNI